MYGTTVPVSNGLVCQVAEFLLARPRFERPRHARQVVHIARQSATGDVLGTFGLLQFLLVRSEPVSYAHDHDLRGDGKVGRWRALDEVSLRSMSSRKCARRSVAHHSSRSETGSANAHPGGEAEQTSPSDWERSLCSSGMEPASHEPDLRVGIGLRRGHPVGACSLLRMAAGPGAADRATARSVQVAVAPASLCSGDALPRRHVRSCSRSTLAHLALAMTAPWCDCRAGIEIGRPTNYECGFRGRIRKSSRRVR